MALAMTLTKRQTNSLKAALCPSEGKALEIRVATSVMRPMSGNRAVAMAAARDSPMEKPEVVCSVLSDLLQHTCASKALHRPLDRKIIVTAPRRMSCVTNTSARRVFPTRVVRHQHVSHTLTHGAPNLTFVRFYTVNSRITAHGRERGYRIPF